MKPVMKIKDDTVVEIYPSALKAANENGLRANHITECARGVQYRQRVGGYVWRYACIILLFCCHAASAVTIKIRGEITEFERQAVIKHLDETVGKIVDLRYQRDDYQVQNGDISMVFYRTDESWCGNTRGATGYTYGETRDILIPYNYMSVRINLNCIDDFQESNYYNAYLNSCLHEVACHAVTGDLTHLPDKKKYPHTLCVSTLSSDKLRWSRRDQRYVRREIK